VFRDDLLLKLGVMMMTVALALVLVAAVVTVALRGDPKQAIASVTEATTAAASVEPLIRGESPYEPWVEKATAPPTAEVAKNESGPEASASKPKPESGPAPEAKPKSQSQSPPTPEPQAQPEPEPQAQPEPEPQAQPEPEPQAQPGQGQEQQTLPAGESGWSRPTDEELEAANNPRHYGLPAGAIMGLTVPGIGIYDAPVFDSTSQWALTNGVAHVPETSLPWSPTPQRNVYLAAHRMGYRGTWSRMLFYNLNELGTGDEVLLKDRNGTAYRYRVSDVFVADPADTWVMGRARGRDMVTLQTCTPYPTFEKRLIVRADRI
jgi:sortase A